MTMSDEHWLQTADTGLVRTDRLVNFEFTDDGHVVMFDILGRRHEYYASFGDASEAKMFILAELEKAHRS